MRPGSLCPRKHYGGTQHKLPAPHRRECSFSPHRLHSPSCSVSRHGDTRIGKHHQGSQMFAVASQALSRVEPKKAPALKIHLSITVASPLGCLFSAYLCSRRTSTEGLQRKGLLGTVNASPVETNSQALISADIKLKRQIKWTIQGSKSISTITLAIGKAMHATLLRWRVRRVGYADLR